ncbi:interleukin-6-like [Protopterus annectens]|uniref:interleukin-6-like n=1 Tax=Protopterus annectens TaxID=7888 RepID=UPI001CF944CF|nr:interleukin-6-like [Protopterus annectens]
MLSSLTLLLALTSLACIGSVSALPLTEGLRRDPTSDFGGPQPLDFSSLSGNCLLIARRIWSLSVILKTQLCDVDLVCDTSMAMILHNSVQFPKISKEDGCYASDFNKQKCFRKIASGLYVYLPYLQLVQNAFAGEEKKIENIQHTTKHLADVIKMALNNTSNVKEMDKNQQTVLESLPSDQEWTRKLTIRFILTDFANFMEKTIRAVRHVQNS